jgi:hypothetical protein
VKKPAAKRSSRTRSGREPSKQPGSEGTTLRLVEEPDDVVVLAPSACGGGDLAAGSVFEQQRRQVFDVSPVPPRAHVTEYRLCSISCLGCGVVSVPEAPKAAAGRVAYGPKVKVRARRGWSPGTSFPYAARG